MISKKFRDAVRLSPKPQYQLAWDAGINPVVLSQIIIGYTKAKSGDERVVRVGELLGLKPEECFADERDGVEKGRQHG